MHPRLDPSCFLQFGRECENASLLSVHPASRGLALGFPFSDGAMCVLMCEPGQADRDALPLLLRLEAGSSMLAERRRVKSCAGTAGATGTGNALATRAGDENGGPCCVALSAAADGAFTACQPRCPAMGWQKQTHGKPGACRSRRADGIRRPPQTHAGNRGCGNADAPKGISGVPRRGVRHVALSRGGCPLSPLHKPLSRLRCRPGIIGPWSGSFLKQMISPGSGLRLTRPPRTVVQ